MVVFWTCSKTGGINDWKRFDLYFDVFFVIFIVFSLPTRFYNSRTFCFALEVARPKETATLVTFL